MTRAKRAFYGQMRRTAYELWRGPGFAKKQDDVDLFGGLCLLRLAIRRGTTMEPQIEARAVYASLADETQPDAILRAVYWNSQTIIPGSSPEMAPMKIAACFAQIPSIQAQQWLQIFEGLQTSLQMVPLQNDSLPICSLRIEIDSVHSVFEKVWQVPPGEQDELTRAWIDVWDNMGNALQTCPVIVGVEESFASLEEKPEAYDLQGYTPVLTLP